MGRYLIRGVEKESGSDTEVVLDAATPANAKVKGEMKGIVVTDILDLAAPPVAMAMRPLAMEDEKPWQVKTIGILRIVSGGCNILAGMVFFWLFLPLALIPLGIIEILSGSNLVKDRPGRISQNLTVIPILEIVAIITLAGWIPLVVGILSLVWQSDEHVKAYLARLQVPIHGFPLSPPSVSGSKAPASAGNPAPGKNWPDIC